MARYHLEWKAGGNGCLPESVEVYSTEKAALAAFTESLDRFDDTDNAQLSAYVFRCIDERCDWCRDAGADVMPTSYAIYHGDECAAFPVCESCANDEAAMNEIAFDYGTKHDGLTYREIMLVEHHRSETCMVCEQFVALDPVGVDSRSRVTLGNRYDYAAVAAR